MFQRALAGFEKELGLEHTSTLSTVNSLALLYKDQGELAQAEAMYQQAIVRKEKVLGPEHRSTLSIVHNIGLLYYRQGKLAEAEKTYLRALKGMRRH
jgi:tetratricopeptide (TPR) repeat protein